MTALRDFFAQSLPLLQDQTNATIKIVNDNARGLIKESAVSERRRHYEARILRGPTYNAGPPPTNTSPSKASRWESELSNSPPAPQRRESVLQVAVSSIPTIPESLVAPQIPRRRVSVKEDKAQTESSSSFARHERNHGSSGSSDGISSPDYALAPPRRRTSCLAWLDEIEANERLSSNERETGQIPETKLQPRSTTMATSNNSTITAIPTDLLLRMDSQLSKISSSLSKKGISNPSTTTTTTTNNKARSSKSAPRRPRRMKSMDLDAEEDDETETSCCDGSALASPLKSSPQPQDYDILTVSTQATTDDENDNSIRSTLSHSIHSVMEQVRNNKHNTTTTAPQLVEDALKGVVGALTRQSSSTRRRASSSGGSTATTKRKGSPTKNRPKRRESPQRMGE